MLLYKESLVNLLHSTFQANFGYFETTNSTMNGIGIVNLGGEVLCDVLGCFAACTACLSPPLQSVDAAVSKQRSNKVINQPKTTGSPSPLLAWLGVSLAMVWLAGFGLVFGVLLASGLRMVYRRSNSVGNPAELQQPPFHRLDDASSTESPVSIEFVSHPVIKSHEFSPGMCVRR